MERGSRRRAALFRRKPPQEAQLVAIYEANDGLTSVETSGRWSGAWLIVRLDDRVSPSGEHCRIEALRLDGQEGMQDTPELLDLHK